MPLPLGGFRGRLVQCLEITGGRRYDDTRKACVTQLLHALRNDTAEKTTWTKVCDVIDAHFNGDLEHVADTLSLLWQTVGKIDDATTAPDSTPPVRLSLIPAL